MPNTSLPETVTAGTLDHPGMHQTVNQEMNRITRDTGWRDLSGALVNGWTIDAGGYLAIRREADKTKLAVMRLNGAAATSPVFVAFGAEPGISTNFRMALAGLGTPGTATSPIHRVSSTSESVYFYMQNAGIAVRVLEGATPAASSGTGLVVWEFPSELAWPSRLPPAV